LAFITPRRPLGLLLRLEAPPFESFFLLRAFGKVGTTAADHALYLMKRHWGGMLGSGATAVWGRFDPQFAGAGAAGGEFRFLVA
jgi:hypothetical protein